MGDLALALLTTSSRLRAVSGSMLITHEESQRCSSEARQTLQTYYIVPAERRAYLRVKRWTESRPGEVHVLTLERVPLDLERPGSERETLGGLEILEERRG